VASATAGYLPREAFFGRLGFAGAFFSVWASDFGRFLPATSDSFPLDVSRATLPSRPRPLAAGGCCRGCRPAGPRSPSWPRRGSQEDAVLQGKCSRVRGSMPFGGQQWAHLLLFHGTHKYCHNGAWPSPPSTGISCWPWGPTTPFTASACRGPRWRSWSLPAVPQKRVICRGKAAESGGPRPLGAVMDSSACRRQKYCHNGGHRLRPPPRRRLAWGPRWRSWSFPAAPKTARLQGKSRKVREVRALWGPPWTRLRSRELPGALASAHSPGRARGAKKEDRSPYARDNFMRRCSDPAECRSDSAGGGHTAEAWLPQGRGELGGPKASSVGGAVMSESYRTQSWSIRTLQSGWNW